MRYIILGIFLSLNVINLNAQDFNELNSPEITSINREESRSKILSYNKSELAMAEDVTASTYIDVLNGKWHVKRFQNASDVNTELCAPSVETIAWNEVTVPETADNNYAGAIYRREFKVPFAWIDREVFVHIGAVRKAYYLYINGQLAGYHEDSKTPAEFNIKKYVIEGKNHIAIVAFASPASSTLENQITTKGTAIEDEIYIISQPKVRIRDWVIDTRFDPAGTSGLFSLGVIVKTHLLNPKQVTVYYDLFAPDSTKVIGAKRDARFEMKLEDTVRFFANIPDIETWSHESPKLYTVALKVQYEGRYTEYTTIKVGFRNVEYDNKGIRINGTPIQIKAVDYLCPKDSATLCKDLASFKVRGINMLKVANHPQSKLFYDMCDAYGIYVCDQANIDSHLSGSSLEVGGTPANDTIWAKAHGERVMNMYNFSKNHPSVIMFSLGKDAGKGYNMYEAYLQLKGIEKERPVVYQGAGAEWNSDIIIGAGDKRSAIDDRLNLHFASPDSYANDKAPQPAVGISLDDDPASSKVTITNGMMMTNLNNFNINYVISFGNRIMASGKLPSNITAGESKTLKVPTDGLKSGKYTMEVSVTHKNDTPAGKKDQPLNSASKQLKLPKIK